MEESHSCNAREVDENGRSWKQASGPRRWDRRRAACGVQARPRRQEGCPGGSILERALSSAPQKSFTPTHEMHMHV